MSVSVKNPLFFLLQSKLFWAAVLSSIIGFMSSIRSVFLYIFLNTWIISFPLESYQIILTLIVPIGPQKTLKESWMKFLENNLWIKWFWHFLIKIFICIFGFFLHLVLFSETLDSFWYLNDIWSTTNNILFPSRHNVAFFYFRWNLIISMSLILRVFSTISWF